MEKDYKFSCGNCQHEWNSTEYTYRTDSEKFTNYSDGYNCPKCESRNVSGEESFRNEDWSGFSNHLTNVFNKMVNLESKKNK